MRFPRHFVNDVHAFVVIATVLSCCLAAETEYKFLFAAVGAAIEILYYFKSSNVDHVFCLIPWIVWVICDSFVPEEMTMRDYASTVVSVITVLSASARFADQKRRPVLGWIVCVAFLLPTFSHRRWHVLLLHSVCYTIFYYEHHSKHNDAKEAWITSSWTLSVSPAFVFFAAVISSLLILLRNKKEKLEELVNLPVEQQQTIEYRPKFKKPTTTSAWCNATYNESVQRVQHQYARTLGRKRQPEDVPDIEAGKVSLEKEDD